MDIYEKLNWKSPRNTFGSSDIGSWTDLSGYVGSSRSVGFFFIIGTLLLTWWSWTHANIIAQSLSIDPVVARNFLSIYTFFVIGYFALVGWEISNIKSVISVISINKIIKNYKEYLLYSVIGIFIMVFIGKYMAIRATAELFPLITAINTTMILFIGINSIGEEAIFRGLIFPSASETWGVVPGVLLSALIFMIFHWGLFGYNLQIQIFTFIFGILAAIMTGATRSIIPSIIMHYVINLVSVAY